MTAYYDVNISDLCYSLVYFKSRVSKGDNLIDALTGKLLDLCARGSDFIVED